MPLLRPGAPSPFRTSSDPAVSEPAVSGPAVSDPAVSDRARPVVATHRLPFEADLASMIEGLVGRPVRLTRTGDPATPHLVARYVDTDGTLAASIALDIGAAASAGASLALIPRASADQWIATGELTEDAADNASEILNVLAAGFNERDASRHVKLAGVSGEPVDAWNARRDYVVDIEGYPSGHVTVLVL